MPAALPDESVSAPLDNPPGVAQKGEDVRLQLKRKAVPLLPSLIEDESSWNFIDEKMKRAREMISSTVSLKPAKLARYDQQTIKTELKERELIGLGYGNLPDLSTVGTSLSYDVIPLDQLRMEERHTPLDIKAFLSRVATFDLRLWSGKPDRLCAYQCARYGWRVAGKNALLCVSCRNLLSIPNDHGASKLEEWTSGIEQQIHKTGHMSDCIWVRSPSPVNILLLPEGNDMQTYMKEAAQSFKRMKTLPVLSAPYRLILDVLDMTLFQDKTGLKLCQTIGSATVERMEQCALFLMLNGWTMDDMNINALQCHLCLRLVPLWLCLTMPFSSTIEDSSLPTSTKSKAHSNIKELDPIASHWFWCPWRKMLQHLNPKKPDNLFGDQSILSNLEKCAHSDFLPNLDNYMSLAVKIDADFKRGRLVYGRQSFEMSDNKVAISTIKSFKELLNTLQSGSSGTTRPVPRASPLPPDLKNEMVSIKPSTVFKNLFPDTEAEHSLHVAENQDCSQICLINDDAPAESIGFPLLNVPDNAIVTDIAQNESPRAVENVEPETAASIQFSNAENSEVLPIPSEIEDILNECINLTVINMGPSDITDTTQIVDNFEDQASTVAVNLSVDAAISREDDDDQYSRSKVLINPFLNEIHEESQLIIQPQVDIVMGDEANDDIQMNENQVPLSEYSTDYLTIPDNSSDLAAEDNCSNSNRVEYMQDSAESLMHTVDNIAMEDEANDDIRLNENQVQPSEYPTDNLTIPDNSSDVAAEDNCSNSNRVEYMQGPVESLVQTVDEDIDYDRSDESAVSHEDREVTDDEYQDEEEDADDENENTEDHEDEGENEIDSDDDDHNHDDQINEREESEQDTSRSDSDGSDIICLD